MALLNPTVMPSANGQLTAAEADIHTVIATKNDLSITLRLANTSTSDEYAYIFIQPSGGTSRVLYQCKLEAKVTGNEIGGSAMLSGLKFGPGDKIRGYADTTSVVNWSVEYAQESIS